MSSWLRKFLWFRRLHIARSQNLRRMRRIPTNVTNVHKCVSASPIVNRMTIRLAVLCPETASYLLCSNKRMISGWQNSTRDDLGLSCEQLVRFAQQDPASCFDQGAISPPLTDQTAGSEWGDVCGICQLFVSDMEGNSSGRGVANALRETLQYVGQPFPSTVRDESEMGGQKPREVICGEW